MYPRRRFQTLNVSRARSIVIALAGNKVDLVRSSNDSAADAAPAVAKKSKKTSKDAAATDDDDEADDATATPANESDESDEEELEEEAPANESRRQVSREEAEEYAKESGLLFFETSAKTGEGVVEVFTEIGERPCPPERTSESGHGRALTLASSSIPTAKKIPLDHILASARGPAGARGAAGRAGAAQAASASVSLNEGEAGKKDACAC